MIASIGFICAGVILAVIYIFTMDNTFLNIGAGLIGVGCIAGSFSAGSA